MDVILVQPRKNPAQLKEYFRMSKTVNLVAKCCKYGLAKFVNFVYIFSLHSWKNKYIRYNIIN